MYGFILSDEVMFICGTVWIHSWRVHLTSARLWV